MTSRQLVDFVEAKLKQHGIRKVIPDRETLASAYRMFAASDRLFEAFQELQEKLENEDQETINVPDDLEAQIKTKMLKENPDITWHRAVRLTVDPETLPDNDDDENDDGVGDDEDLSDIDE